MVWGFIPVQETTSKNLTDLLISPHFPSAGADADGQNFSVIAFI